MENDDRQHPTGPHDSSTSRDDALPDNDARSGDNAGPSDGWTVAWFATLGQVRTAEQTLERNGIDAVNLFVEPVDSVPERADIDDRTWAWIGRRAVVGSLVGLLVGALVGLAVGAALNGVGSTMWMFALGGAVFGVAPGFFYWVGTRLPAEPEAFDTFAGDGPGDNWLAVVGPPEVRRRGYELLREMHPIRLVGDDESSRRPAGEG